MATFTLLFSYHRKDYFHRGLIGGNMGRSNKTLDPIMQKGKLLG